VTTSYSILLAIGTTVGGFFLRLLYDVLREKYRFRKELRDNNSIDVTASDWYAAWQTSVDNKILLNTERLSMKQKGNVVKLRNLERSPENPEGGYLWEAKMNFYHGKFLMGWYFPLSEENNTSKGIMFMTYHSASKTFYGMWVGCAYDGDLACGFVTVTKDRKKSRDKLEKIISLHPHSVNIISTRM